MARLLAVRHYGRMKQTLKKFAVILLTALGSLGVAALQASFVWPEMAAKTRGLDPQIAELVRMPMIFETCIVFFATAYYLGQALARRIGDFRSSALLRAQGMAYMRLLHVVGGVLIIACRSFLHSYYGAPAWQNGLMICFGIFLVVKAIWESFKSQPKAGAKTKTDVLHDA